MDKKNVFVIMPFKDIFFEVYEMLKAEFSDKYVFSNAAEEANQQNILTDIIKPIYEADVIIADLTGLNPNVMYELGLAHTFNKKTITITQDDLSTLPFDLKQYRAKDYNTHFKKFAELVDYLKTNLDGAIDDSVSYSNPVKDFLTLSGINDFSWSLTETSIKLKDNSEKGFIDFLAEIETNANSLTQQLIEISSDMNEMNKGIVEVSEEINRANKNSGQSNAAFVRKKAKKAAEYIDTFGKSLRQHNKSLSAVWDEIEINSLGLLENTFATKQENHHNLIAYLKSLGELKANTKTNIDSIQSLKSSIEGVQGIERYLTQAIRFLKEDLNTYINIMERIQSSIDKITAKSRFIVGNID